MHLKKFLILCLLVAGCAGETEPDYLLDEDKMTKILTDIHLAEAKVNALRVDSDTGKALFSKMEERIFEKHATNRADFDSSRMYYIHHIKKMDKIYGRVVDTLSLRQSLNRL